MEKPQSHLALLNEHEELIRPSPETLARRKAIEEAEAAALTALQDPGSVDQSKSVINSQASLTSKSATAVQQEQKTKPIIKQPLESTAAAAGKKDVKDKPKSAVSNSPKAARIQQAPHIRDMNTAVLFKRKIRKQFQEKRELNLIYLDADLIPSETSSVSASTGDSEKILDLKEQLADKKLCCHFLVPTNSGENGLHTYRDCAKFVSDSCALVPLESPLIAPKIAKSPNLTLQSTQGSSLDLALLLASMLIGVGYDAYVVSGYACRDVAENSLLNFNYDINKDLSEFIDTQSVDSNYSQVPTTEQSKERSIHYWVLVQPGSLGGVDSFFIEPATGALAQTDDGKYYGIDFVFNHENIWVNLQPNDGNSLKDSIFELADGNRWVSMMGSGEALNHLQEDKINFESIAGKRHREMKYHNASVSYYSGQEDGLVKRLQITSPPTDQAFSVLEWFKNRDDKLVKRAIGAHKCVEIFDKGRNNRKISYDDNVITHVWYNTETRMDSVTELILLKHKLVLKYEDRDDKLHERTIHINEQDGRVTKIGEKFKNGIIDPATAISYRKIIFDIENDRFKIHTDPKANLLMPKIHTFQKISSVKKTFAERYNCESYDPQEKPLNDQELITMYDFLLVREHLTMHAVKSIQREWADLAKSRRLEEQDIVKQFTDSGKVEIQKAQEQNAEEVSSDKFKTALNPGDQIDYLSAFLIDVDINKMDSTSAIKIREQFLKSVKERLVMQSQIMHTRVDKETGERDRLQNELQKHADLLSHAEKEQIRKDVETLQFKLDILESRIAKHKEEATRKYIDMDNKIRNDPRIGKHLNITGTEESLVL